MSPSKFLQEQGGIEGIIQEAARGVYSRGEKWGVAKALRGAVQGLQSASSTPTRLANAPRWSLDVGGMITDDSAHLAARIQALEQRNKALAKLLEKSMEDLWVQQREFTKDKAEVAADALSLAIAKVQFVQVYLENPSMPLPNEEQARKSEEEVEPSEKGSTAEPGSPVQKPQSQSSPLKRPITTELRKKNKASTQDSAAQSPVGSPSKTNEALSTSLDSIPGINILKDGDTPEVKRKVRPAIAQSSFSWILGDAQRKSEFIAASPFSTERDRARGKAGFLFGDEKAEDLRPTRPSSAKPKGKSATEHDEEEKEAITMATIKAAKEDS